MSPLTLVEIYELLASMGSKFIYELIIYWPPDINKNIANVQIMIAYSDLPRFQSAIHLHHFQLSHCEICGTIWVIPKNYLNDFEIISGYKI